MDNNLINELYSKLDAQDKIINTQALEIARLNEKINIYEDPEDMTLMFMWCDEKAKDKIKELQQKIDKVIEYINNASYFDGSSMCANDLLEILGDDKE